MKRNKIMVIIGLLGLAVLLVVWGLTRQSPNVNLQVGPKDSAILLDGANISPGKQHLKPGTHQLKVTHSGFAEQEQTVIAPAKGLVTVAIVLLPNSDEGRQWLIDHPGDAVAREGVASQAVGQTTSEIQRKNPLVAYLPFIDQLYRIDYGPSVAHPEDPTAVAIHITYFSDAGKQQALDWIKFKGVDPANLEIVYEAKNGFQ